MFKQILYIFMQFPVLALCVGVSVNSPVAWARRGQLREMDLPESGLPRVRKPSFWRTELWYAQTPGLWNVISELKKKSYSLPEIDRLMQDQYNRPDEGMARLSFRYYGDARDGLGHFASYGYAGVRGDLLVGGVAKNRIFPFIQGYKTYSAQFEFGLADNPEQTDPDTNWSTQWGSVLGIGSQELMDGLAIDLYPKPPIEKTSLFFWGLDFQVGYDGIFNEGLRAENRFYFQPTLFHADATDASYAFQVRRNDVRWRWRSETQWWIGIIPPALELSFFGIGGQQPVPTVFLPRVWDSVHEIAPFPAAGQLIGLGSGLSLHTADQRYSGTARAGFFGGYFGAVFQLRLKWFEAGVGTVGLEQTSGYRVTESRVKYGQIGIRHEF